MLAGYLQCGTDFLQFNIRFECRIIVFLPSKTENYAPVVQWIE